MGIAASGYGLSAFVYAAISGYISGDDTAAFLLILAVGTSTSMFIAASLLTPDRTEAYAPIPMSPTSAPMFHSLSSVSRNGEEDFEDYSVERESKGSTAKGDVGGIRLFATVDYYITMVVGFCITGSGTSSRVILKGIRLTPSRQESCGSIPSGPLLSLWLILLIPPARSVACSHIRFPFCRSSSTTPEFYYL